MMLSTAAVSLLILCGGAVGAPDSLRGASHARRLAVDPYWVAFQAQNANMVWPVPNSTASDISSTFGPRIRSSCSCYDFHRGIDIHGIIGDQVRSSFAGVVKTVTSYSDGGLTVVLEHKFSTPFEFHGKNLTKWFTVYMHLSAQLVTVGQNVTSNFLIGLLGMTGSAMTPHLHQEVRLGTQCSLEFALDNPSSTCNKLGIDPHVHPLMIYPAAMLSPSNITLSVSQIVNFELQNNGTVHLTTPDTAPNVNRYLVQVMTNGGTARLTHVLDLNLRTGFNASSTAAIDTPDKSKPYLSPIPFGYTATNWDIDLVIPYSWVGPYAMSENIVVTVTNIWGASTVIQMGH